MHDHDDLQWLIHGSSMACSQNIWQNMARPVMERIHMHHTSNNTRIHANHIREYQSQLWNNFSSLRTLQRSLIQTATLHEHSPWRQFIPKIFITREGDIREKIKAFHSFQNTSTSQQRTSQMIRFFPTAFSPPLSKDGYMV